MSMTGGHLARCRPCGVHVDPWPLNVLPVLEAEPERKRERVDGLAHLAVTVCVKGRKTTREFLDERHDSGVILLHTLEEIPDVYADDVVREPCSFQSADVSQKKERDQDVDERVSEDTSVLSKRRNTRRAYRSAEMRSITARKKKYTCLHVIAATLLN